MSALSKFFDNKKSIPINRTQDRFLAPFFNFQQEFDNLFDNFRRSFPMSKIEFNELNINPAMDIVEDEKNFKIEFEMPGVDEQDIKVSIDNSTLTIKATKETSKKDEKKDYIMREISYGSYERTVLLPENLDIDKAQSTFKKGMLWVDIPKKDVDKSKVKELEVKKAID
jgi:HSP20 family protein